MAESIAFSKTADKKTVYGEIAPQIEALVAGEADLIANLANVTAVLKEAFGFFWVGFYLVKGGQLVLGPHHEVTDGFLPASPEKKAPYRIHAV